MRDQEDLLVKSMLFYFLMMKSSQKS